MLAVFLYKDYRRAEGPYDAGGVVANSETTRHSPFSSCEQPHGRSVPFHKLSRYPIFFPINYTRGACATIRRNYVR